MSFLQQIWQHPVWIPITYLLLINLALFLTMGADKLKAKRGGGRVSEATLFLLALLGGSVGGIVGMYCFRHKTKHLSFVLGFPVILLAELALAAYLIFQ